MEEKLIEYLGGFVTSKRLNIFDNVLRNRTKYITVVLENIYQSQNASAVLRTCDCFGIQDVYIIENNNKFNINPHVALGSSNWLNIIKYNNPGANTTLAIKDLKEKGYRIIATSLNKNSIPIDKFDITKDKIAFFFGNELNGLSKEMQNQADDFVTIPMFGFTESFNISVSASIILSGTISKLRNSQIIWNLSKEEKNEIKLQWLKNTIKKSDLIVNKFYSEFSPKPS